MPTTPSTLPHQNKNLMDNGKWYRPKTWWAGMEIVAERKNNMIPFALISL